MEFPLEVVDLPLLVRDRDGSPPDLRDLNDVPKSRLEIPVLSDRLVPAIWQLNGAHVVAATEILSPVPARFRSREDPDLSALRMVKIEGDEAVAHGLLPDPALRATAVDLIGDRCLEQHSSIDHRLVLRSHDRRERLVQTVEQRLHGFLDIFWCHSITSYEFLGG